MAVGLVLMDLVAHDFDYPPQDAPTPDKSYGRETLLFPTGVVTSAISRPRWMPHGFDVTNGVTAVLCWKSPVTTGNVGWTVAIEKYEEGQTALGSDHFDTSAGPVTDAVPNVAHTPRYTEVEFAADPGHGGTIPPGTMFRIKVTRSSGSLTGNAELLGVLLFESEP
jgi:hypothetical protein